MKRDYVLEKLKGIEQRNRERAEKRIMYRVRHRKRKALGTVREYGRYVRKLS